MPFIFSSNRIPKMNRRCSLKKLMENSAHKQRKMFTQFEVPGHGGSTMEDKFDKEILPWIANLRNVKVKEKRVFKPTEAHPPSFYEKDMERWNTKFSRAIEERAQFKKTKLKTCDMKNRQTNTNFFSKERASNGAGAREH